MWKGFKRTRKNAKKLAKNYNKVYTVNVDQRLTIYSSLEISLGNRIQPISTIQVLCKHSSDIDPKAAGVVL